MHQCEHARTRVGADRGVRPYRRVRVEEFFRLVRIRAFFYGGWFTITSRLGAREGLVLMMTCGSAGARVVLIPVDELRPNPAQPRGVFDPEGLQALADSIRQYGVLQPLSVRMTADGPELIAGERRLRAAKLAGLRAVPCLPVGADEEASAMLALIENIQRRDLDFWEQARGIAHLLQRFSITQEQAARRLGMSQSAVANKLRILRLPEDVLQTLRDAGLGERHARALLRLPDADTQRRAARLAGEGHWSVARLEEYVDAQCRPRVQRPQFGGFLLRDARVLLNAVQHHLDLARSAGIGACSDRRETDREIILTIHIPKQPRKGK